MASHMQKERIVFVVACINLVRNEPQILEPARIVRFIAFFIESVMFFLAWEAPKIDDIGALRQWRGWNSYMRNIKYIPWMPHAILSLISKLRFWATLNDTNILIHQVLFSSVLAFTLKVNYWGSWAKYLTHGFSLCIWEYDSGSMISCPCSKITSLVHRSNDQVSSQSINLISKKLRDIC